MSISLSFALSTLNVLYSMAFHFHSASMLPEFSHISKVIGIQVLLFQIETESDFDEVY